MKAKRIDSKPEFTPLTFEVTLESLDEVRVWWHMFNMPACKQRRSACEEGIVRAPTASEAWQTMPMWDILNDELLRFGERRL